MHLRIIKAGILDTIQDMGRYGFQHLGINPCGVMDKFAMRVGNILMGNEPGEAVIELHFPASEFFFEQPALISICGANFSATLNGDPIPCWQPVLINKFSILQFAGIHSGARAYLAIKGGLDIPSWLGSYSTHLKAGAGGFKGRALQKEDEIAIRTKTEFSAILGKQEYRVLPWKAAVLGDETARNEILLLPGNEWDRLTSASKDIFIDQPFTITPQSDRMGYRLKGKSLSTVSNEEVISAAVDFGTIQLLPDGQLIALMADHQTTGGYPRVAHVISAHHSKLAQFQAGEAIRFRFTGQDVSEELLIKQQQHLLQLQNACSFRLEEFFKRELN